MSNIKNTGDVKTTNKLTQKHQTLGEKGKTFGIFIPTNLQEEIWASQKWTHATYFNTFLFKKEEDLWRVAKVEDGNSAQDNKLVPFSELQSYEFVSSL